MTDVDPGPASSGNDGDTVTAVNAVNAAKSALRHRVLAARRARAERADAAVRQLDAACLTSAVLALLSDRAGGHPCRVAAYRSMASEPPTERLVEALLAAGHEVVVPVTLSDLDLDWAPAGRVPGVIAGLDVETLGVEAIAGAALVVTPGLAVDRLGHRLGRGGGSYDRALARRSPGAFVVTLLYDEELLGADERVPVQEHDVRVDAVVTPGLGTIRVGDDDVDDAPDQVAAEQVAADDVAADELRNVRPEQG